jgi:hypothetical protein
MMLAILRDAVWTLPPIRNIQGDQFCLYESWREI